MNHLRRQPVTGLTADLVTLMIRLEILARAISVYRNPLRAARVLSGLVKLRKAVAGGRRIKKYNRISGRFYWGLNAPGWPSVSFRRFIDAELSEHYTERKEKRHLQTMIYSITGRCPLRCEHCFEWENLGSKEPLDIKDLKNILRIFQRRGISQVQLSGGEPLCRFEDLIRLLESAKPGTDFWLLTSGYELTAEKAARLREAGLTGVNISLDHWDEKKHNAFRGNDESYRWVMEGAKASLDEGMALAFSVCATRSFVTRKNLWKYVELAERSGAHFIQILEPRKTGHYSGMDVELGPEQISILEEFFFESNFGHARRSTPIVMYPGYHQRITGCFGAGNRYLHVDAKGDIHACPFCRNPAGNALEGDIEDHISRIRKIGCHKFDNA